MDFWVSFDISNFNFRLYKINFVLKISGGERVGVCISSGKGKPKGKETGEGKAKRGEESPKRREREREILQIKMINLI